MPPESKAEFSPWRAFLWPIRLDELKKLIPMLLIFFLLSFDYNILRTLKDVLVVTAKSSGAEVIPFIKVWVMFPGSILMTFIFTRLSNRYSREMVFYVMVGIFLVYFFLFTFFLYPMRESLHLNDLADSMQQVLPEGFKGFIAMIRYWSFTSFYVMSELWSNIVLFLLFWGFANQVTSMGEAKRFYGLFGIGANFSGIVAGLLSIYVCQYDENAWNPGDLLNEKAWEQSLFILVSLVITAGLGAMALFRWMHKGVLKEPIQNPNIASLAAEKPSKMSIRESFSFLLKSRYLIYIALIVIAYNLVINLVEVLWKHEVRELYPNPSDYSIYMNQVTTMIGVIATFTSLFISGNVIRFFGWTWTALIPPVILLVTSIGFFGFFFIKSNFSGAELSFMGATPLIWVVFFGTAQNCLSRAAKYTVYDTTKEMAFVPLSEESKLKGKAAVDGVCSRLGKSGGAFIHQSLLLLFSTLTASAPYVAAFLLIVIFAWTKAVVSLGALFDGINEFSPQRSPRKNEKIQII